MPQIRLLRLILVIAAFGLPALTYAQSSCPTNIDFSRGNFTNWVCNTGMINPDGSLTLDKVGPVVDRQTLNSNKLTDVDFYGDFPVTAPNGSLNTLRLGNGSAGDGAESVSYTYSIPNGKDDFIFTYYYAVVLNLPPNNHTEAERPRFSVKLTDITDPLKPIKIDCGSHDFVSGDGFGDFQKSKKDPTVEFRDWSTVAINLAKMGGHTIRFDFTTNDCAKPNGSHFGYAYVSFSDPCDKSTQAISGNTVCNNAGMINLTAPPGFDQYNWHLPGDPTIIGTSRKLTLATPPNGTTYVVDVLSFRGVGQGCPASFSTAINILNVPFLLKVLPSVEACKATGADLTAAKITAGTISSSTVQFKYYSDLDKGLIVRDPTQVLTSGVYYIQGTNENGCTDILPIRVDLQDNPSTATINPTPVCKPQTVDLTSPDVLGGQAGYTYEYFRDFELTKPEANPKTVSESGIFYVRVTNQFGCSSKVPVNVVILDLPSLVAKKITGCAPLDITQPQYNVGDTNADAYSYFADAAGKIPLTNATAITQSGVYYANAANALKCTSAQTVPITVTISPAATLTVTNPDPVKYPYTIDVSKTVSPLAGYTYTYFTDSLATKPLKNYTAIGQTGKYFIKATNTYGCDIIRSVLVTINESDPIDIKVSNTFSPNGDGINDEFNPTLVGAANVNYLKIYSRNGALVFETKDLAQHWKGAFNGAPVPPGTYYWVFSGFDNYRKITVSKSGYIMLVR